MKPLQTILGSGGAIGTDLAKSLAHHTDRIRLVSRNPKKVNPQDELWPADLTKSDEIRKAIAGSEIVYVTIGFNYSASDWERLWPPFMQAVVDGCVAEGAKLVFFDNVYLYSPSAIGHMIESSLVGPSSRKGKVRAALVSLIETAVKTGKLQALIARSADFYGPYLGTSVFGISIIQRMKGGKGAQWFGDANKGHNFTHTGDAARATALLGNTADAYNRTWHLPTDKTCFSATQWVSLVAKTVGIKPNGGVQVLPIWLMPILGLFVPVVGAFHEMVYQYTQDYFLDSSAFEARFPDFKITPPTEVIKEMWAIA